MPLKKIKKSKTTENNDVVQTKEKKKLSIVAEPEASVPVTASEPKSIPSNNVAVQSKKSRKRAADFMNDEEESVVKPDASEKKGKKDKTATLFPTVDEADEHAKKKSKKSKKSKKDKHDEVLTADGVNGVVEHSGTENLETATKHKPISTSMQAEAERTVDQELEHGFEGFASEDDDYDNLDEVEEEDNAAALLAGFDSDTEDKQEDEGVDLSTTPALPKAKKVQKKLEKLKAQGKDDGPGTVYVGRIPHGFYEKQMKEYFSQFGDITRLRLSRNKRTGASKHFAFIEFSSNEVAKIAAATMDNYLLFGHILKCKYAEPNSLHPDVWNGANKKFRKIPHEKLERELLAAPKSEERWQKKVDKEQRKRDKKAVKMKAIGLDMPTSTLTKPSEVLRQTLTDKEEPKQLEDESSGPVGLIEPPNSVSKDEAVVKEVKKPKKDKHEKKAKEEKKEKKDKKKKKTSAVSALEPVAEEAGQKVPVENNVEAKEDSVIDGSTLTSGLASEKPQSSKEERKAPKKGKKATKREANETPKGADGPEPTPETTIDPAAAIETAEPIPEPATATELQADFISLGKFDDDATAQDSASTLKAKASPGKKLKLWKKEKKPKKERKNLVKARGPKSNLVPTKPKPDPNAAGKIPGLPLMGKGKYDKATRQAHKEMKKNLLAQRHGRGGGRMGMGIGRGEGAVGAQA